MWHAAGSRSADFPGFDVQGIRPCAVKVADQACLLPTSRFEKSRVTMSLQPAINWAIPCGRDMRGRWARTASSTSWRLTAIGRWQLLRFVFLKILDTYLRPRPPKPIADAAR